MTERRRLWVVEVKHAAKYPEWCPKVAGSNKAKAKAEMNFWRRNGYMARVVRYGPTEGK